MTHQELIDNYKTLNKKVLISIKDDKRILANGMAIQEQRGKKDIVYGIVELAQASLKIPPRAYVWFPMYAALPVNLAGNQYVIVDYEDIYLIENIHD